MNQEVLRLTHHKRQVLAFLRAEEEAIERLLQLAADAKPHDPTRASMLLIEAKRRTNEVLDARDWLDRD